MIHICSTTVYIQIWCWFLLWLFSPLIRFIFIVRIFFLSIDFWLGTFLVLIWLFNCLCIILLRILSFLFFFTHSSFVVQDIIICDKGQIHYFICVFFFLFVFAFQFLVLLHALYVSFFFCDTCQFFFFFFFFFFFYSFLFFFFFFNSPFVYSKTSFNLSFFQFWTDIFLFWHSPVYYSSCPYPLFPLFRWVFESICVLVYLLLLFLLWPSSYPFFDNPNLLPLNWIRKCVRYLTHLLMRILHS